MASDVDPQGGSALAIESASGPLPAGRVSSWARAGARLAARFFWSVLAPGAATLAVLGILTPSRIETLGAGTLGAVAATAADHLPLVGVGLFLLFWGACQHWRRRLGWQPPAAPARPVRVAGRLAVAVVLLLLLRSTVAGLYRVEGASMSPTLTPGDHLLVDRRAYGFTLPLAGGAWRLGGQTPRRGEVIVFSRVQGERGSTRRLVKRVMGLPGDLVGFRDGAPVINGWAVPTCEVGPFLLTTGATTIRGRLVVEVLDGSSYLVVRPADDGIRPPVRVPPGQVFVVGDAREVSEDSRSWKEGPGGGVGIGDIVGRVAAVAVGVFRDGRVDLTRVLAPLRPRLREPGLDLRVTEARLAACLARAPRASAPPPAAPPAP